MKRKSKFRTPSIINKEKHRTIVLNNNSQSTENLSINVETDIKL
jgi:hypothetical protein